MKKKITNLSKENGKSKVIVKWHLDPPYQLIRDRDGAGDGGGMLVAIDPKTGLEVTGEKGYIRVGYCVMCGSTYARTYQQQDWWRTTPVKKILEVGDNFVKFETVNGSTYLAKGGNR
jgi:hypothetical protein